MTCNEARYPFIGTHDELKTTLNHHLMEDDNSEVPSLPVPSTLYPPFLNCVFPPLNSRLDSSLGDDDEDGVALKRKAVDRPATKRKRGVTNAFVDHRFSNKKKTPLLPACHPLPTLVEPV